MWSWKVRIEPSDQGSFEYMATFSLTGAEAGKQIYERQFLNPRYLYGQGDLAVFLEDLGADVPEIGTLLDRLNDRPSAEILVDIAEEAMEVLWHGQSKPF